MEILHLPETAFAWMFIPLIGGMVVGSAWGGKRAHRMRAGTHEVDRLWRDGRWRRVLNVGLQRAVRGRRCRGPCCRWSIYTFGLAVAMPAIQVSALALFPDNRGLASSMLSFIQMMSFALVSGLVAPLLFDSAFKLALRRGGGVGARVSCAGA